VLAAVCVLLVLGVTAFRKELTEEWFVHQFRRNVAEGDTARALKELAARDPEAGLDLALRLSRDPDPRVREAVIEPLTAGATRVRPETALPRNGVFVQSYTGLNHRAEPALQRLLADPDPAVRRHALKAVSELMIAWDFGDVLRDVLRSGPVEERLIVCASLAHWDGRSLLDAFVDPAQPFEVRSAALASTNQYGWRKVFEDYDRFDAALRKALADPDVRIRHLALRALRHHDRAAPLWLEVLRDGRPEDRAAAAEAWIDALVNDETRPGDHYPHLHETEALLSGSAHESKKGPARMALVAWVLCQAAQRQTALLDKAPRASELRALRERQLQGFGPENMAFAQELNRVHHVVQPLNGLRWCLKYSSYASPDVIFTGWLPDEEAKGQAPTRNLRAFLLAQMRGPLTWCRAQGNGYASRFLRTHDFHFGGPTFKSGEVRGLADVLDKLQLISDEQFRKFLEEREDQ
jgi:hypothetical protein